MRHFGNPYPEYNGAQVVIEKEKIKGLIGHYVKSILQAKAHNDGGELYTGSSGIAFMFLKLHLLEETRALLPSSLQNANVFIEHAKKSIGNKDENKAMFLCGNAGIYAVSALIKKEQNNMQAHQDDMTNFLAGYPVCQKLNYCRYGSDEVLFGRAGYLSGIYWLNQHLPTNQKISQDVITNICDVMIESGAQYSQRKRLNIPMMWECYGGENKVFMLDRFLNAIYLLDKYLGAAHGICAILHMMLEAPLFAGSLQQLNHKQALVKSCIDQFLQMQSQDGNFPCVLEDAGKSEHKLVHWCHGAPGAIYLFAKAYLILKEQKYLDACLKCGELVWQKGLLKKGPGICHGIAGNGYVFLILYRLTNDQKHLYRATCFGDFLTNQEFLREARTPDKPLSLYEGVAGTVCYLVDLLSPQNAQFPFMDVFDTKF